MELYTFSSPSVFICQSKCKKFQICIEIRNNKCYTVYANIKNIQRYI